MTSDGAGPVKHVVIDNFVRPDAGWHVPPAASQIWEAVYDNDSERGKRTTRRLPAWALAVAQKMLAPEVVRACGPDVWPDTSLWGGGLQVIAPGGHLSTHLDGCVHPRVSGARRAVQMVCFCHPVWEPGWGGRFYFTDAFGTPVTWIDPLPGRLVAFEQTDLAYHGVEEVAGPAERVTVTASLLAPLRPTDTRVRALFMPNR